MLLSHQNKFIFFHIPKTGGTSLTWHLRHALETSAGPPARDEQSPGWQDDYHFDGRQHSSFRDNLRIVRRHPKYFRFAFVRNPWDLALSWYTSLARRTHDEHLQVANFTPEAFKSFLRRHFRSTWCSLLGGSADIDRGYRTLMARSQSDYVSDRGGNLQVDFVARYENYEQDLKGLLEHIGIEAETNGRVNQSRHGELDYRDFYDSESRDWIARRFRRDVELFGYEF